MFWQYLPNPPFTRSVCTICRQMWNQIISHSLMWFFRSGLNLNLDLIKIWFSPLAQGWIFLFFRRNIHPCCDTHLNVLVKSLQGLPASLLVRPVLLSSKQGIAQKISVVLISIYIHFGQWGWGGWRRKYTLQDWKFVCSGDRKQKFLGENIYWE